MESRGEGRHSAGKEGIKKRKKEKAGSTSFTAAHLKMYFRQNFPTLCGSVCTCTALHVQLFIYLFAPLSRASTPREWKRAGGGKNKDDEE